MLLFIQKNNVLFDSLPPKPQKKKRCTAMLLIIILFLELLRLKSS